MEPIRYTHHRTDYRTAIGKVRRVTRNWANYKTPGGLWLATDHATSSPQQSTGTPADWEGNYDFRFEKIDGPLQYFAGDTTDPDNTTLVGVRSTQFPQFWVNFKALGVTQGTPWQAFPAQRAIGWINAWQNSDLFYGIGRASLEKRIRLNQWPHPLEFRFAMRIPNRMSYTVEDEQIIFRRASDGFELMRSVVPFVEDSAGNQFKAHIEEDGTAGGYPAFRLYVVPAEVQGAQYPVWLDPSVTLRTNLTECEDAVLAKGAATLNYGARNPHNVGPLPGGASNANSWVFRIITGGLPAGTITGFNVQVRNTTVLRAGLQYRISTNNNWVAGTQNGGVASGDCSYNHAVATGTSWAGSAGCQTSGTDYDASPSFSYSWTATSYNSMDFTTSWVSDWRDGVINNNGLLFKMGVDVLQNLVSCDGVNNPIVTIDYEEATGAAGFLFSQRRIY